MIDFDQIITAEMKAATALAGLKTQIDRERDRRNDLDIEFLGKTYTCLKADRASIANWAALATVAIVNGAMEKDLGWNGGASPFAWLTSAGELTPMDAQNMKAFGLAVLNRERALIYAAHALKVTDPILDNFTDDRHWRMVNGNNFKAALGLAAQQRR